MLIIPAIDLRAGKCVRLTQGRADAVQIYGDDPVRVAQDFEQAGARMLHVVDLDAALADANSVNRKLLGQIVRAVKVPVQFGGGIRTMGEAERVLDLGAARIVVGTMAVESPALLVEMLRQFSPTQIAVGIDARNGMVVTRGWLAEGEIDAESLAKRVAALGVPRIVYTDTVRDGTLAGPNIAQTRLIAKASGVKVTASGGVSSLEDLQQLKAAGPDGIDSVIVGKAFYEGRFSLAAALATVSEDSLGSE